MVETRDDMPHSNSSQYIILEQFLLSKTENEDECEDALYVGPHFIAVIDGATSKTNHRWNGKTGGRIAAEIIKEAFSMLPSDATARQAVDIFTAALHALYKQHGAVEQVQLRPVQRAIACVVAISFERKELWFVGDCQCLLGQELIQYTKELDIITANARSLYLEAEIAQGKTIEELLQDDTGRKYILPLLENQMIFQNDPSRGQYWFPVIDGFPIPDEGIHVVPIPTEQEIVVLASDGYPLLRDSLEASEQALKELLTDDPLLFRSYRATKGLQTGTRSFDDRAYLKIAFTQEKMEE